VADEFAALCLSVPPGEYVQLIVSDNGCGMTPEVKARMFEPFFTTKGPDKGTGLGLSTVYGIVKHSGGAISVHSGVGLGTTVRVLFPATQEPITREQMPEPIPAEKGSGTILLVEDEDGVLHYVRDILTRAGYNVLGFNNAPMAIDAARHHAGAIDLLITDFVLPGTTGSEIQREVQRLRPGIPALVMSGYTDRLGRREQETSHYLQKPFSAGDLLSHVRSLVTACR
jgi:CheY-like chemotaxis protein